MSSSEKVVYICPICGREQETPFNGICPKCHQKVEYIEVSVEDKD